MPLWLDIILLLVKVEEKLNEFGECCVDALLRVFLDLHDEGDWNEAEDVLAVQLTEHANVLEKKTLV